MKKIATVIIATMLMTPVSAIRHSDNPEIRKASQILQNCVSSLPQSYKQSLTKGFTDKHPGKRLPRFLRVKNEQSKAPQKRTKESRGSSKTKSHQQRDPKRVMARIKKLTEACKNKTLHKMKSKHRGKKQQSPRPSKRTQR